MKYIVQYTLPYEHRVQVGIEADTQELAIARAEELFNIGDIWDDTTAVPLLLDVYEETSDSGMPLVFTIESEIDGDWPEADASVREIRRQDAAFEASRLLLEAFQHDGVHGGRINWTVLNKACQAALNSRRIARPYVNSFPFAPCQQLAVIVKNGLVQSVMADRPETAPTVAVIDYNVDGAEPDAVRSFTQSDGNPADALVELHQVDAIDFNLDDLFQKDA